MPNYLALEWGRAGIRGLDAEVTGDAVQVRSSFTHEWPADLDAANDPGAVGLWLRSQFRDLGAKNHRLIVIVSREDIALRLLALPEASDEALPDLVRYQMGARSSVPLDQLAFDFLPLVAAPPPGGRWVQSASVPKRLVQHIMSCAEAAGLDLCAVGASSVARGEAIARAERLRELPDDQKRLVVSVVDEQLEVTLWRGADLLFSHLSRTAGTNAVLVEVQRALMSHDGVAGKDAIQRVWLIAPQKSEAELRSMLATRLGCDVLVFEPSRDLAAIGLAAIGLAADSGPYVAALGALLASGRSMVPAIDFLNPRRRIVRPPRTKMFATVATGVLLLLLGTAYLVSRLSQSSLDASIAEKEHQIGRQDKLLKQGEPALQTMAMLSTWERRRVDWLDQMQRIAAEMPGTEHVYLDSWRFDLATGEALATTAATGFARQRQDAERWTQRLAEQPGLRIRPNAIEPGGSDPEYPVLLQLDAEVVSQSRQPASGESE